MSDPSPAWSAVLEAAARLQSLVPGAVLADDAAAAHHAGHRVSFDDDHVVADLKSRFDEVLAALEATDGWVTARVQRPVLILGRLEGVETGVRNATRDYVDFAALADRLGESEAADVVLAMDAYYADQVGEGGRRIATQVAKQLREPLPDDLSEVDLATYRELAPRWRDWSAVREACRRVAERALDRLGEEEP